MQNVKLGNCLMTSETADPNRKNTMIDSV